MIRSIIYTLSLTLLFSTLYAQETPPDSILKKVEDLENITAIKYLKDEYSNGNPKSKGWAYLFQDGKKTKFVRLGHWQYFRRDGTLEFEDYLPVSDELPVKELHYDKDGNMWKKVFHAQEFDKNKNLKGKTYVEEEYYQSGKIKSRKNYKDGKKIGTWKWFDEAGSVINQKEYGKL